MQLGNAWLKKRSEPWVAAVGLGAVVLLDLADFLTAADIRFSVLYLAAVVGAGWAGGRRCGIIVAITAAFSQFVIEALHQKSGAGAWVPYFNVLILFCLFSIVAVLASSMRELLAGSEKRVAQRTAELQKEITDRERIENELRASAELFRQITDNIKEVFWMTNIEKSQMIYISPGYETIWGRPCESLYASPRSWLEAIDPEDLDRVTTAAMQQKTGSYDEQYRIVRPDGSRRWIRDRAFPVYGANGSVYRIAGIADDITAQKEAEQAVHKSELQLRLVWENSLDGMRLMNEEGTFIAVNQAYSRLVGMPRERLLGNSLATIFAEERREHVLNRHRERFRKRSVPAHSEEELSLWNGKRVFLEITSSFVEIEGSPTLLLSMFRDVSERKHAEAALTEKEERFRRFMNNSSIIAFVKDADGRYEYVNSTLQSRFNYSLIGKTGYDLFPAEVARRLHENDKLALATNQTLEFTDSIPFPDGSVSDWINYKFPFRDSQGRNFVGCVSVEVTEQRKLEKQLLEISDREQGRIGHDLHDQLCQFLVGILFHCQDLHASLEASRRTEAAQAERIAALVNSAITQARQLARGLFPVLLETEGLVAALEELAASVNSRAKVECSVECERPISISQKVVSNHLYRIAQEAVNNATHHADPKQIIIRLQVLDSVLELAIVDDGVGLRPVNQPQGMGMHIMDYRARSIGGVLEINSRQGGGTSVVCRVPLEKVNT